MGKILTVDGFEITHLEGTNAFVVKGEKLTLIDKFEWQDETTDRWPIVERAQVAMDSSNYYQCENKFSGGASIPACQGSSPGLDMGYLGSLHSTTGFTNEDVSELHSCFGYMESWDYYAVFRNMEPKTISIPRIVLTGVFFIFCMWIIQLLGGIRKVLGTIGESLKAFFRMLQREWRAMMERRAQAKLLLQQQAREKKEKEEREKAEREIRAKEEAERQLLLLLKKQAEKEKRDKERAIRIEKEAKELAIRREKEAAELAIRKEKEAKALAIALALERKRAKELKEKEARELAFYNSPPEVEKRKKLALKKEKEARELAARLEKEARELAARREKEAMELALRKEKEAKELAIRKEKEAQELHEREMKRRKEEQELAIRR